MKSPGRFPLRTKVSELPTYRVFFVKADWGIFPIEAAYRGGLQYRKPLICANRWCERNAHLEVKRVSLTQLDVTDMLHISSPPFPPATLLITAMVGVFKGEER